MSGTSSGVAHFITPSISHVFMPKTGRFSEGQKKISLKNSKADFINEDGI
jgi:hypothetical protein